MVRWLRSVGSCHVAVSMATCVRYMHAVLQESIRMVTTVPVNQRVNLDEDVTIGGQVGTATRAAVVERILLRASAAANTRQ